MNSGFNIWQLFAGVGLFLFGMTILEEAIRSVSGRTFRRIIRHYTDGVLKAVGSGAFVTAIIQSSSAVSLMVLAFAGAGVMTMENGVGVIMGSNLGTTFTAWIVALLGFKIKIESFILPVIAVGGTGTVLFSSYPKLSKTSAMLAGFGLLFLGLDYMKESTVLTAQHFDFQSFSMHGSFYFLLAGILLTALMQSSSASIAMFLTALNSHLITFDQGVALVIGANIGTTVTALIGCIGGTRVKLRVGLSHLIFNLATGIIAFAGANLFVAFIRSFIDVSNNSVMALAFFHTLFNLTGIIIFLPFVHILTILLNRIAPDHRECRSIYICHTPVEVVDAAIISLKKEILHLLLECQVYGMRILSLDERELLRHNNILAKTKILKLPHEKIYEKIKLLHGEIFSYYARLQSQRLGEMETKELERFIYASRNIMNALKDIKGIRHDIELFEMSGNSHINRQCAVLGERLSFLYMEIDRICQLTDRTEQYTGLVELFTSIEKMDKEFINDVMRSAAGGYLDEMEISSLLMVNRLFTQSSRLQVFALKDLLLNPSEISRFDSAMERRRR